MLIFIEEGSSQSQNTSVELPHNIDEAGMYRQFNCVYYL